MRDFIDLRSDTVTKPSKRMREVMAKAEVGDDVFGEDPTVNRLQARAADLFGKDAALFVPSGTMANQLALRCWVEPGGEAIVDARSHMFNYEGGAAAGLSGIQLHPVPGRRGIFTAEQVKQAIRAKNVHFSPTRLVCVENTHNLAGGVVFPVEEIRRIRMLTADAGIPMHLDGARIFNAVTATGIPPQSYGELFDSLSFCLSKGLGAPIGSVLVGDEDFIERCRFYRKRFGGGMRQVGIIAAAGLYALEHNVRRLADDHRRARDLAEALSDIPGVIIDPSSVETNIVLFDLVDESFVQPFVGSLRERGVLILPVGGRRLRAVTHLGISDRDLKRAVKAIQEVAPKI